ncbi:MAG: OmpH family outer membrane protein [Bacteroidota bacterium]
MKKYFLVALFLFAVSGFSHAQKYAYVDSQYILDNLQDYKDAQEKLDALSVDYQKEVEAKFSEIDKLYKKFQAESVLLPDEMKKQREEEIVKKEKDAKDLQKKRFGKEGDLFKKRQELVKPIQDKVYNAVEDIATKKSYAFIFDKAGTISILYADPKLDVSDDVLKQIGGNVKTKGEK